VVDDSHALKGLITVTDFRKAELYPNACKDELGRLRVGAAVGTGAETPARVEALVEAGCRCDCGGYCAWSFCGRD
jgi:IMP dehydrogenase